MTEPFWVLMFIMTSGAAILLLIITHVPLKLYIAAKKGGIKFKLNDYIFLNFSWRYYPFEINKCLIKAAKAGVLIHRNELEIHYHANGEVSTVVDALIEAKKYNVPLDFEKACRINLARKDLGKIIKEYAFPLEFKLPFKIIEENGTPVRFYCKIKYRGCIERAIDGSDFNTLVKLIIQELKGIVVTQESINLFTYHFDEVSKRLMAKSFDLISAYELLSIDIFREKEDTFA
jgi:uncharacterized protein YqfA (UPF0365 family)